MQEPYLDNAARFRLLIKQLELATERATERADRAEAAAAAASAAEYAPPGAAAGGHPLMDRFILEMLYEILAARSEGVYYHWRIDAINPPELRERILQESGGRPYIVLYTDAEELRYNFAHEPPPPDSADFA